MKKPIISENLKTILEIIALVLIDAISIVALSLINFRDIAYGALYFSLVLVVAAFTTALILMAIIFYIRRARSNNKDNNK